MKPYKLCDVCSNPACDGYGLDWGDREMHTGYRAQERIAKVRRQYGNKVADQIQLEDEQLRYY